MSYGWAKDAEATRHLQINDLGGVDSLDPLNEICALCHIKMSTGSCTHLLDLGDGRVAMSRSVWEGLIEDRHRLHEVESATETVRDPSDEPDPAP